MREAIAGSSASSPLGPFGIAQLSSTPSSSNHERRGSRAIAPTVRANLSLLTIEWPDICQDRHPVSRIVVAPERDGRLYVA